MRPTRHFLNMYERPSHGLRCAQTMCRESLNPKVQGSIPCPSSIGLDNRCRWRPSNGLERARLEDLQAPGPLTARSRKATLSTVVSRIWRQGAVAVAVLAASACGGSAGGSSSSGASPSPSLIASVDACSLVTASEASSAAGTTLTNMVGVTVPGACFYGQQGGSAGVFVYAQAYPDSAAANAVTAQQMSAALGMQVGAGATSGKQVSGIGDKAYEFTANGTAGAGNAIIVFKTNVVIMILVDPSTSSQNIEQLAKTAVGRLH